MILVAAVGNLWLGDDGFAGEVAKRLRQRGVPESSAWRLVNRERPEWTRERWDEAQAELRGEIRPMAAMAAMS